MKRTKHLRLGVIPDGSKWWKDTGIELRLDGVLCKWTLIRGVSSDKAVEWESKYWEASDEFGYKELGSEKSGRDDAGNVWREYWRETRSQEKCDYSRTRRWELESCSFQYRLAPMQQELPTPVD